MTENLEKYRALYDFVTDPTKSQMFNSAGLFGSLIGREHHEVLKLFANWVDKLKKQNGGQIPITLSSVTFLDYLKTKGQNEKTITEIERLHRLGIIQNEPPAKNTFLKFARILNALNIVDIEELIIPRYEEALENIASMKPISQATQTGAVAKTLVASATAKKPSATIASATATAPAISNTKKIGGTSIPSKQVEIAGSAESTFELESESAASAIVEVPEKQISLQTPLEPSQNPQTLEKIEEPAKAETLNPANEKLPNIPQIPSTERRNGLLEPKSDLKSVPGHTFSQSNPDESSEQKPPLNSAMPNLPSEVYAPEQTVLPLPDERKILMRLPKKKVRSLPGGIRQAQNTGPRRIRDLKAAAQNRQAPQTQGQSLAQNEMNQEFNEQNRQFRRQQQEEAQTGQRQPNTNHLGKKLAKLAGAGVGAGAILPLFSSNSDANAATFVINHGEKFLKPLIILIHFFLK